MTVEEARNIVFDEATAWYWACKEATGENITELQAQAIKGLTEVEAK